MEIIYKNNKVKEQCTALRRAKRDFSEKVAKKIMMRINFITAAENLDSIINNPVLHFHKLKGNLDGKFAIDVDGRRTSYRLIVQFDETEVFENAKYIEIIEVTEVSNHYE